jgi:hypothetical protein
MRLESIASKTSALLFALPALLPHLFRHPATVRDELKEIVEFGAGLITVLRVVHATRVGTAALEELSTICADLLAAVPNLFAERARRPKWHYALGHVVEMIRRYASFSGYCSIVWVLAREPYSPCELLCLSMLTGLALPRFGPAILSRAVLVRSSRLPCSSPTTGAWKSVPQKW